MPVTATKSKTLQQTLNDGNLNEIANVIKKAKLGTMLRPLDVSFTITAAASLDLTSATAHAGATVNDGDIPEGYVASKTNLPAANHVRSLRVIASGTAGSVGSYICGDPSATMIVPPGGASVAVGIARLSADGKTVTFPNTVTQFRIVYLPKADTALSADFAPST